MRRFRSFAFGAGVLSLLLGTSVLADEEQDEVGSGTAAPTVQLIGWSPDEQRYAFRVYSHVQPLPPLVRESKDEADDEEDEEEKKDAASKPAANGFCAGYVDTQGKPFVGALTLVVFERDKRLLALPIQDEPQCTPPDIAAARLTDAMKKLTELGIAPERSGRLLALAPGKRIDVKPEKQAPYALEFVDKLKTKDLDTSGNVQVRGVLELYVHREGKRQKVYTRKVDKGFHRELGGVEEERLTGAQVSPSGERAVVLGLERSGNLRGGYTTTVWVATVLGWPGTPAAQEK